MVHKQNWSLIISVKIVQVYTPYIKCDRFLIILWKFSDAQTMCNDWSMLLRYKIQSRQILHNADALINKRPTGLGGHLSTNVPLTALSRTCQSLIFPFWSLNPLTPLTVVPLLLIFKSQSLMIFTVSLIMHTNAYYYSFFLQVCNTQDIKVDFLK